MPPNTIYVGRPTKWGNPYPRRLGEAAQLAVERYRFWLIAGTLRDGRLPPQPQEIAQLRGKHLACWCPEGTPCHADVLLSLANE